jgi:hypothetical protein
VLSAAESESVWAALKLKWGISTRSYWYPLTETFVAEVFAFNADAFHKFVPAQAIRRRLLAMDVRRIWELREDGAEYEEDVEVFEPIYNGDEGVWTARENTWVLYVSHESSVTVAGTLLSEIKQMWPEWRQYEW